MKNNQLSYAWDGLVVQSTPYLKCFADFADIVPSGVLSLSYGETNTTSHKTVRTRKTRGEVGKVMGDETNILQQLIQ